MMGLIFCRITSNESAIKQANHKGDELEKSLSQQKSQQNHYFSIGMLTSKNNATMICIDEVKNEVKGQEKHIEMILREKVGKNLKNKMTLN